MDISTTQEHIDGLISFIWNATENRSVTNVMVARVLDWLNRRALQLQGDIAGGHSECRAELDQIREQISKLNDFVKGVNTLAGSAYGRADTNARAIERSNAYIYAILRYLETGRWPDDWDSGGLGLLAVKDVDRGPWAEGEMYYNGVPEQCDGVLERSHVWYLGCKYVCLRTGTQDPPRWNSPDWAFEEGDPEPRIVFSGVGDPFMAFGETKTVGCTVLIYNQDATADVAEWEITRDTGSKTEDEAWRYKDKVRNFAGSIDIAYTHADNDIGYEAKAVFKVTARLLRGREVSGELEI